jgi:methionine synthase II (cobalamin-independent)
MAATFRVETLGSLLRPVRLQKARRQFEQRALRG